ncbi:hypothetical protein DMC30DRAFT_451330 [Rhodotorula diobovata]|uniref:F-box domain-containing protein n=1 Tax=Rhodotorula diobovata TaxID=5288 RepID=A0A5C5FWW2_9BASI|nr:hypothetical protein DMC30DRAFT_451330 [Rhodotorula diobovata]
MSAPSEPSTSPSVAPGCSIPDELWIQVLDELDYNGLHKAAQLCKRLKRLTQDQRFDEALFRKAPSKPLREPGTKIGIHPLLQATNCIFTGGDAFAHSHDAGEHSAFEYAAVDEYATRPTCKLLMLNVRTALQVVVRDKDGVTVRKALEHLGNHWAAKPPDFVLDQMAGALQGIPRDEQTWRTTLGERDRWTGWDRAVVTYAGVTMYALQTLTSSAPGRGGRSPAFTGDYKRVGGVGGGGG